MADKCAICGADINLIQTQRLADGNCICRKNCRQKGFKVYDYVHGNLPGVKAHLAQVERGTRLWDHYFVPREKTKDKTQKLKRFGSYLYVAEDIGLMAFVQNDYKFMMFGKTTRACVYRIADLRSYQYEEEVVRNGDKTEKKSMARLGFINTEGLYEFVLTMNNIKEYEKMKKYFDTLFGIQNTLGNAANVWKQQMAAVKDITVRECDCGVTERAEVPATGHNWDSGKITKNPTAQSNGEKVYTCLNCKAIKVKTVKFSGISEESDTTNNTAEPDNNSESTIEPTNIGSYEKTHFPWWLVAVIAVPVIGCIVIVVILLVIKKQKNVR